MLIINEIMTVEQQKQYLKKLGLKKQFKTYQDGELNTFAIKTHKPATIVDGWLVGSEIVLYGEESFEVWTPKSVKANRIAKEHNLKVRLLDGEAIIWIPLNLADELLPKFGAKVKKNHKPMTPEQIEKFKMNVSKPKETK